MAVQKEINYEISYGDPSVTGGISVFSEEFDDLFYYEKDDLGCTFSKESTVLKVWAPTASEAYVVLYDSWDGEALCEHLMQRQEKGVWFIELPGNYEGKLYTYKVKIDNTWNEAADPYAKAVAVNGDRSAIIDFSKTNPTNWPVKKSSFTAATDAIIYELHIRDLSMHPESGMTKKGKFLGLCEQGTTGPNGIPTGLSYIKDLGVTHVQLLPIYDYSTDSVDETKLDTPQYNWGYDPKNYNVPEGSYSTNPYEPSCRIKELKELISTLHNNGLRVVMDVVYNHVYDAFRMNFMKLVPGYYFRYNEDGSLANGSACGNDTASERKMVRKFIVDSVVYWAREYHLDGFRFDLMGLHDVETMNEIRKKLDLIDPSIITIGEGWVLDTPLVDDMKANQTNAPKMPNIAHFNDYLRDGIKGSVFFVDESGFVNGKDDMELEIKRGLVGGIEYSKEISTFAIEPTQTVSYVEAHDNHTLWDKLALTNPGDSVDTLKRMHKLASAIVLTSQGIAFIHAGQEFMRTKGGDENSYKSSTEVNQLDWERCSEFQDEVSFMKKLIAIRKKHPAFRMKTAEEIRKHLFFEETPEKCVAFTLRDHANGDADTLCVAHNASRAEVKVTLPFVKEWSVILGEDKCNFIVGSDSLVIAPLSSVILVAE
ncbi:MAG: type I pullulanase [Anaerobacillus sp.]|uniref:type I pullulanase n=1 Tax=Anaerobacillus sp. TaxID=1872506 RepID=UPI00391A888F